MLLPELSLILLIGPSSAGKTTFARRHFSPTQIVSSDHCRLLIADSENTPFVNREAFELLHFLVRRRLKLGNLTVVDATNVRAEDRSQFVALAKEFHVPLVAIVFAMPLRLLYQRNEARPDRDMGNHVVRRHFVEVRRSRSGLAREGFRKVYTFNSPEEVDAATVELTKMPADFRQETGPFDLIGDVHGCQQELLDLLAQLGYTVKTVPETPDNYGFRVTAPGERRVIFIGDIVDKGPENVRALKLCMSMVRSGVAYCVLGNHDEKLRRYLNGSKVQVAKGLEVTVPQIDAEPEAFRTAARDFITRLPLHLVLDEGRLVVAHAGLREDMHLRIGGAVRAFCLYGETTGEVDEFGLPVRYPWARDYRGRPTVVYGHTPVPEAEWINRTIDIDTGCVYGGKLTALRYPERELVSVAARATYAEAKRPIGPLPGPPPKGEGDSPLPTSLDRETGLRAKEGVAAEPDADLIHAREVLGRQVLRTRYGSGIKIRAEQSAAAFEIMTRSAADPGWLIYLPPTMAPVDVSPLPNFLEHPAEAFAYYLEQGVDEVVCERKHMGSRALVIVGKSPRLLAERFRLAGPTFPLLGEGSEARRGPGRILTRTGRPFFADAEWEAALLSRVQAALNEAEFWRRHETDWVLLDCELLPWSAKAQALLEGQYAAVGAAGALGLDLANEALAQTAARGIELDGLAARTAARRENIRRFRAAYRHFCRPTREVEQLQLAPFHILATEGRVHADRDHRWHLDTITDFCRHDEVLLATEHRYVDLTDDSARAAAIDWWLARTAAGDEGMVVKPVDFLHRTERGLIQPALKVRGREYLRIIYGPDYLEPENLARLKKRRVGKKRGMAIQEFSLGLEALHRFVEREPLGRVHQCVFGILALESEAVDPAL